MGLINEAGTYRGVLLDRAVTCSRGNFPQFVAKLQANEVYDKEIGEFVTLEEVQELTAYLILFDGQDKETLAVGQIQKVLGWNGVSFSELNELDCIEASLQFRVKESVYGDKVNYQVEWIDDYDAEPGFTIKRLDPVELKSLDARYKSKMKTAAPVSAQTKKEKPKPVTLKTKIPKTPESETKIKPSSGELEAKESVGEFTKEEAWAHVWKGKDPKISEAAVTKIWKDRVQQIAGKKTDEEITPHEWYQIAISVNDETGILPF